MYFVMWLSLRVEDGLDAEFSGDVPAQCEFYFSLFTRNQDKMADGAKSPGMRTSY